MIVERPKKLDFPLTKGFTYRGVIYIPSTTSRDKKIKTNEFNRRIRKVSRQVADTFGGNTVQRMAFGSWIDNKGKLVKEKIVRIEFFTNPKTYLSKDSSVGQLIHRLAKQWGQDEISFEFQTDKSPNTLHFVPSNKKDFNKMIYSRKLKDVA